MNSLPTPARLARPPFAGDARPALHGRPEPTADDDARAVLRWVRARGNAPHGAGAGTPTLNHTQRGYLREAQRFLLWLRATRGKGLAQASLDDCLDYRDFLADPQSRAQWCAPRSTPRASPNWRPFEGPLSASARRQAITVLRVMYRFLQDQQYLHGNPWTGVALPRGSKPRLHVERSLTREQWQALDAYLRERAATDPAAAQCRWEMRFLYTTGLRLHEAIGARFAHLEPLDAPAGGWLLHVVGKGGRERRVPVPDELIDEASRRLTGLPAARGLVQLQAQGRYCVEPLGADGGGPARPLSASALYRRLAKCFAGCADGLEAQGRVEPARQLRCASTHWLRHTHATHAVRGGVPVEVVQQNLGHASLGTTSLYVSTAAAERAAAMQRLWAGG